MHISLCLPVIYDTINLSINTEVTPMKKITKFLRFLALLFFMFLAVVVCFVFNRVLDQKIEEQHSQTINTLESIKDNNSEQSEE